MKNNSWIFSLVILILAGLALVPSLQKVATPLVGAAAVFALIQLILRFSGNCAPASEVPVQPAPAATVKPVPVQPAPRPEAEVIGLLSALQAKGRLVDFLMDDITKYEDAQVGAAARVVHQGCSVVLKEHFEVQPQHDAAEGSSVTVPVGHAADEYRLTGNLNGEAPFTGTLVHKGWKTVSVKLPRLIEGAAKDRLPAIAPAEVEIK